MAGIENFLASVLDCAAAFQSENDDSFAVNAPLDLAKLPALGAGLSGDLLHTEKRL